MDKYINATKVLKNVKKFQTEGDDFAFCIKTLAEDMFNNLPAADVTEINHGKWRKVIGFTGVEYMGCKETYVEALKCSVCEGTVDFTKGHYKYCPHCGAKMDAK